MSSANSDAGQAALGSRAEQQAVDYSSNYVAGLENKIRDLKEERDARWSTIAMVFVFVFGFFACDVCVYRGYLSRGILRQLADRFLQDTPERELGDGRDEGG
jgi:hypothetical protein